MEINQKTRMMLRLQGISFVILFLTVIVLLAWLSQRYSVESDWTATKRNTLSEASITLLNRIEGPIDIIAFASNSNLVPIRQNIKSLINQYKKHKPDIELKFIDPELEPDKTRQLGISVDGELIIGFENRSEHVTVLKEETITNTLQRLFRSGEKKVVFLGGHGERNPTGGANHDYGMFSKHLLEKGINTETINLSENPQLPEDTTVLVIAGPQMDYLDGEIEIIRQFIQQGGHLLWLHDPGEMYNLDKLADTLNIQFTPGMIVDPTTQLLGVPDPTFALVARYGSHPITKDFNFMTLYPRSSGIKITDSEQNQWQVEAILQTVERSWSEVGKMEGTIEYTEGKDVAGPLNIGMALTRQLETEKKETGDQLLQQRILVLGDGDFISNAYIGNQGNQDMGYNLINWLTHDDSFISIPITTAKDVKLELHETTWGFLGLFFLLGIPALLLVTGLSIWLKRRKR